MSDHLPSTAVTALIERCVSELGLDLDAVELRGNGPRRLLRVVVDADGGVPLDVVTQASRELSRELDRSDAMGTVAYTLEVTSRGLDRPLTLARHWARNIGRLVVVTTIEGGRLRGRLASASEDSAQLEDGTVVAFEDVKSAVVEPELTRRSPASPSPSSPVERNG
jgi:ribosome maturation factor RimP